MRGLATMLRLKIFPFQGEWGKFQRLILPAGRVFPFAYAHCPKKGSE
jgi:hypothetical protein